MDVRKNYKTLDEIKIIISKTKSNIEILGEFTKETGITSKRITRFIKCRCKIDGYEWNPRLDCLLKPDYRCPKCSGHTSSKFNHEEVIQFLKNLDFELLSENYKNQDQKLKLQDKNGYLYETTVNILKLNCTPDTFSKFNPYTIQNIKLWLKLNNKPFKLLSDTYEKNSINLSWKCLKEGCKEVFESTWNNILRGNGCGYCAGKQVGLSNCLANNEQELIKEWHPTKNGDLTPYDVTTYSHKEVWWQCKECKHEWISSISNRTGEGKRNCPECSKSHGEKECKRVLDLKNVYYIPQK